MYVSSLLCLSIGLLISYLLVVVLYEKRLDYSNTESSLEDIELNDYEQRFRSSSASSSKKHLISYNVLLTAPGDLLKPLKDTWASEVKHVHYYMRPKKKYHAYKNLYSPFIKVLEEDDGYPMLATMKMICGVEGMDFFWYALVRESTYIRVTEFETHLKKINIPGPFVLGSLETSRKGRDPLEMYCSGMAIFMNQHMFKEICPKLIRCTNSVSKFSTEASEFSSCLGIITGRRSLCAHSNHQLQRIFFHVHDDEFSAEDLSIDGRQGLLNAFVFHPFTKPDQFYHFHHQLLKIKLSRLVDYRHKLLKEEEQFMLQSLQKTGHLQSFPKGANGVLNVSLIQSSAVNSAVNKFFSKTVFSRATDDSSLSIRRMVQDLDRGVFELKVLEESGYHFFTHKSLLQWSIKALHQMNHYRMRKVNFVVGVPPVSESFQKFMMTFEMNFLSRSLINRVSLLIVLFAESPVKVTRTNIYAVATFTEMYQLKYPDADIQIVSTVVTPSWRNLLLEVAHKYLAHELVFIATTRLDFAAQLVDNCLSNAIEGSRVYFPMPFSPYDQLKYQKNRLLFPYAIKLPIDDAGNWLPPVRNIACLYVSDLINLLNGWSIDTHDTLATGSDGFSLLEAVNLRASDLKGFAAPESALVSMWREGCSSGGVAESTKAFCDIFTDDSTLCKCDELVY